MKRRGSWQINFIVRALTGMGQYFSGQSMDGTIETFLFLSD